MNAQPSTAEIIERDRFHSSGALSPVPVVMTRGAGVRMWDMEGNPYLDCTSGIGVAALGHAHPALTAAIADQASILMTCASGYFHHELRTRLAEKLVEIAPGRLQRVFLSNSGTEAVETAIKLARVSTGRTKIVAAMRGFHGRTLGALSATWTKSYRAPFDPLVPGVTHVPYNDPAALAGAVDEETAAVLLEPVQGEGGIYPATQAYLEAARESCTRHDAMLIFDEVQSGMGRTGRWFACEHYGVDPDILCAAKALGGGMPIAATLSGPEVAFSKGQHGSTFGGNPLACRASLTVIDTIERDGLLGHVSEVGGYFLERLTALQHSLPETVRDVRGLGLMLALELRIKATPVLKALLTEHGILALSGGSTIVRFLPPYTIDRADVDTVIDALECVLS